MSSLSLDMNFNMMFMFTNSISEVSHSKIQEIQAQAEYKRMKLRNSTEKGCTRCNRPGRGDVAAGVLKRGPDSKSPEASGCNEVRG
jgi:hypothetical protein